MNKTKEENEEGAKQVKKPLQRSHPTCHMLHKAGKLNLMPTGPKFAVLCLCVYVCGVSMPNLTFLIIQLLKLNLSTNDVKNYMRKSDSIDREKRTGAEMKCDEDKI